METYPVVAEQEVRWRDTDGMGHVNNAVYFTYFEMARLRYHEALFGGLDKEPLRFILASATCDYLKPLFAGERIRVGIRMSAAGKSSFDFEYAITRADDDAPVARGRSTQVFFDYEKNEKCEIPAEWIDRIERFQESPLPRR